MSNTIYIKNKYYKIYNQIIDKAKSENRNKSDKIYYESHHIIPKSIGGSNEKENLVLLTAREHYICHYLLTKFTTGTHKAKMVYAFHLMNSHNKFHKRYVPSMSILYEQNKIKMLSIMKKSKNGYKHSKETKNKISKTRLKRNIKHSKETRKKFSDALNETHPMYKYWLNKNHTKETKNKISKSKFGKNNQNFIGYWVTPFGNLESFREIKKYTNLISKNTIDKWCKNPDIIITKKMFGKCKYLQTLTESPIGKTVKEIGFYFKYINDVY